MRNRLILAFLACSVLLLTSMLYAQRRASSGMGSIAKLIVVVDGESKDWSNWGFLWDAGRQGGAQFNRVLPTVAPLHATDR